MAEGRLPVLLLAAYLHCVWGYSNGDIRVCDVDNPALGVDDMDWSHPPFHSDDFTVRSGDVHPSLDQTSYYPNEWVTIHLRANRLGAKMRGLLLYAEASGIKVGEWRFPEEVPARFWFPPSCGGAGQVHTVAHASAADKPYHTALKFRAPAGLGPVTIKALVQRGRAHLGEFLFPNAGGHLVLEEGPARPAVWYEGVDGESCDTVCAGVGLECDAAGLAVVHSPAQARYALEGHHDCPLPVMSGCTDYSPHRGEDGRCYFHDQRCGLTGRVQEDVTCAASSPSARRFCACKAAGAPSFVGLPTPAEVEEEEAPIPDDGSEDPFPTGLVVGLSVGAVAVCVLVAVSAGFAAKKFVFGRSSGGIRAVQGNS